MAASTGTVLSAISIHALLAESDQEVTGGLCYLQISIHALLAESDMPSWKRWTWKFSFLSTLSLRRATTALRRAPTWQANFYPRSPCGERRKALSGVNKQIKFLSTLSLRRATQKRNP